jgi:hypothetical protein
VITTVTTSTVTTITELAAMDLTAVIGAVAVVALVAFLSVKELSAARTSPGAQLTTRFLNVGIVPMAMAFAVMVVIKVVGVLA